jgi:response regulator RpfG family c-di-GMP phosphodiesterase
MSTPDKPCLLVVDDEPEVCDSVSHLLYRNYRVLRAHSAAEAVELLSQHAVEIIMTDQRMPEITGVEMLQKIKSQYPEAIRILFTGYADLNSVIAAINQGHVYRYLSKPWQPEELEAVVADAAAEYSRIVQQAQELTKCRERIAQLERENQRLRELSKDKM